MRLATDTKLYASDPTPPQGYTVKTISRNGSAYANFISAFKKAENVKDYKWWDKSSFCYRYGRRVRVYWNSADHRTDLSYFINTYITGGQSYDGTGNGYYTYLTNKQSGATADQTNLIKWLNFFRNSYETFRNLPTWSPDTAGERRYITNDEYKMAICVEIPYDANKKQQQKEVEQEDRTLGIANKQVDAGLDELEKGGSDKNADSAKSDNRNWLYIAAGILGFAVILKLIKKHKGKA